MTGAVSTSRYEAQDLETASIRSVAPSYISEAPSYHSSGAPSEVIPAYSPRTTPSFAARHRTQPPPAAAQQQRTVGLPPVPALPPANVPSLHNYKIPTWSPNNSLAARHYHSVAQRRVTDGWYTPDSTRRPGTSDRSPESVEPESRPLEDPYLVGEVAATTARRERIARENGEDILVQEDKHWDWLIIQMKGWDERERSWTRFRREAESRQRKNFLRRIGGLLL